MDQHKASVRVKVEQLFFYVKKMFGYDKMCRPGLAKSEKRQALLVEFAKLLHAQSCMV